MKDSILVNLELDLAPILKLNNPDKIKKKFKEIARTLSYFKDFSKRQFRNPKGYILWNDFLNDLSYHLMLFDQIEKKDLKDLDFTSMGALMLLRSVYWYQYQNFPCYWLDKNLMTAFLNHPNTDALSSFKRVHEYQSIFIPKNLLYSPNNMPVNYIIFAHRLKGDSISLPWPKTWIKEEYSEDILEILTFLEDGTIYLSRFSPEEGRNSNWSVDKKENHFVNQLVSIVLQSLLWLQVYCPTETIPSGTDFNKKSKSVKSLLNPRWIDKRSEVVL